MLKLNPNELKAKQLLEKNPSWCVFKPSYPDFILCTDQREYCLVEVKRDYSDQVSTSQTETLTLLQSLGIPVYVMHLDDKLEEIQQNILRLLKREINIELRLELLNIGLHLEKVIKNIQNYQAQDADTIDHLYARCASDPPLFEKSRLHSRNNFRRI